MLIKQALAVIDLGQEYAPAKALGGSGATFDKLLNPLIENALIISGILTFGVILLAGFTYISGAGDKNKMTQATNMLNYAILGLVVVVSAFLITRIIGKLLGFDFF